MCQFRRLNCYRLETDGVDFRGEKVYMLEDFIRMMWTRTAFLGDVLRRGYNFIFTDTDVIWLRNPFTKLSKNETEDFQISTDVFNGDPWSENNLINIGFYSVRSNNKTVELFDEWYLGRENATGKKEQDVLLDLIREGAFRRLDLRVRFLDMFFFSGFCEDNKDFTKVATVHVNCCRSITAKVFDLNAVLRDWKRFKWSRKKMAAVNGTTTEPTAFTSDQRTCGQKASSEVLVFLNLYRSIKYNSLLSSSVSGKSIVCNGSQKPNSVLVFLAVISLVL